MNENHIFTGSKVKKQFTAYFLGSIRGRKSYYLKKKMQISDAETPVDEFAQTEMGISIEETLGSKSRKRNCCFRRREDLNQNGMNCQSRNL